MNIYTPLFLDGDNEVPGKFLVIATDVDDAIQKTVEVLIKEEMAPYLYPYSHYTPFANKVRINIPINGILCL